MRSPAACGSSHDFVQFLAVLLWLSCGIPTIVDCALMLSYGFYYDFLGFSCGFVRLLCVFCSPMTSFGLLVIFVWLSYGVSRSRHPVFWRLTQNFLSLPALALAPPIRCGRVVQDCVGILASIIINCSINVIQILSSPSSSSSLPSPLSSSASPSPSSSLTSPSPLLASSPPPSSPSPSQTQS